MNNDFFNCQEVQDAKLYLNKRKKDLILKLIFDKVLALILLILFSPIFFILGVMIKLEDKGPVFYRQERVTKNGKIFKIYKFRTMVLNADKIGSLVTTENDSRITKIGSVIRKYRLDEIPQLLNIIEGDMSFVGARPALWNQYDLIAERDKYNANSIRPGLTGWAQINGRDELEIEEKSRLDGYYVAHMSFLMDLKCFFGTFISVLKSDGVVEGGTGTKKEK